MKWFLTLVLITTTLLAQDWEQEFKEVSKYDSWATSLKGRNGDFKKPNQDLSVLISKFRYEIKVIANKYGVKPEAIVGAILAENTINLGIDDAIQNLLVQLEITPKASIFGREFTFGWGQLLTSTAMDVEHIVSKVEGREPKTSKEVVKELYTPRGAITYVAAVLKDAQDTYAKYGYDISSDIGVLTTLYNLGKPEKRASFAKSKGLKPKVNYYGLFVRMNEAHIEKVLNQDLSVEKNFSYVNSYTLNKAPTDLEKEHIPVSEEKDKSKDTSDESITDINNNFIHIHKNDATTFIQNYKAYYHPSEYNEVLSSSKVSLAELLVPDEELQATEEIAQKEEIKKQVTKTYLDTETYLFRNPDFCAGKNDARKEDYLKKVNYRSPQVLTLIQEGTNIKKLLSSVGCNNSPWVMILNEDSGEKGWIPADIYNTHIKKKMDSASSRCVQIKNQCTSKLKEILGNKLKVDNGKYSVELESIQLEETKFGFLSTYLDFNSPAHEEDDYLHNIMLYSYGKSVINKEERDQIVSQLENLKLRIENIETNESSINKKNPYDDYLNDNYNNIDSLIKNFKKCETPNGDSINICKFNIDALRRFLTHEIKPNPSIKDLYTMTEDFLSIQLNVSAYNLPQNIIETESERIKQLEELTTSFKNEVY